MALRRTLLVLLPLLTTACMNNGIEWSELDFTRTKPSQADLVGTWSATKETIRDIQRRGKYEKADPKLILSADGTCAVTDMPDWWRGGVGESHKQLESGQGKWRIEEDKNVFRIYVVSLELPAGNRTVNLNRQKPPYQIHITLGDPDSGTYMLFDREPAPE